MGDYFEYNRQNNHKKMMLILVLMRWNKNMNMSAVLHLHVCHSSAEIKKNNRFRNGIKPANS